MNRKARAALCAGLVASAALLASCGGGGSQVQAFVATRVISFGDELSAINTNGSKYTVNALIAGTTNQIDCSSNPIWVQSVAAIYGLAFPQCPGTSSDPSSRIYATNGALVADVSDQIDQHLNTGGGFISTDLVTVLAGANDVMAQFQQYPGVGEDQLTANLVAAGAALAGQVNRLAGYGAKVLIVTIPDMGLTPAAGDRSVGTTDGNPALLTRLSTRFNDALLANLLNDGHKIGLVQLDEYLKAVDTATINGTSGATFSNTTLPACSVALPNCTTNTLVADAVNAVWLWADGRHLGATGQASLGSLAVSRAQNNPF
ncbi:MAG: SGNH/GDSL hydrolase family protein [Burkholderiales bacterium]